MSTPCVRLLALFCASLLACGAFANGRASTSTSFSVVGSQATQALIADYYDGAGRWRECDAPSCTVANSDWGTDAATDTLYIRWSTAKDAHARAVLHALIPTTLGYPAACNRRTCAYWSDTAAWDAVALLRLFEATGDSRALRKAADAYRFVSGSSAFVAGACPAVPYQQPVAARSTIKTLETLANEIKAAVLLYRATHDGRMLEQARSRYADARTYFLDESTQLYTIHLRDDGAACTRVPGRYFASVNGLMIWNGVALARITGATGYRRDALTTAHAVERELSDGNGIFTDAGGENDVVEPLVEGMLALARSGDDSAAAWIRRNAGAALGARGADGSFARFFNGPPQKTTSIWESNGGFAIEIAAAALDPEGAVPTGKAWTGATIDIGAPRALPLSFTVDGSAFALSGTMNAACMHHHLLVTIDGTPIPNRAGLWQNPSMPERSPVVFAWQWRAPGVHTVTIDSDPGNTDEISLRTYVLR